MKLINLFIVLFVSNVCLGQSKTTFVDFAGQQPNSQINVRMAYHTEIGATGQQFGIIIKNLTADRIKVYGRYYANLVNGNAKSKTFEDEIKPNETLGGNGIFGDYDLSETVFLEDCKAVNNTRIKSVGFQITSVVNLTELENKKNAISEADKKYKEETKRQYEADQKAIKDKQQQNNQQETARKKEQDQYNQIQENSRRQQENNKTIVESSKELVTTIGNIYSAISKTNTEKKEILAKYNEFRLEKSNRMYQVLYDAWYSTQIHVYYYDYRTANEMNEDWPSSKNKKTIDFENNNFYNLNIENCQNCSSILDLLKAGKYYEWLKIISLNDSINNTPSIYSGLNYLVGKNNSSFKVNDLYYTGLTHTLFEQMFSTLTPVYIGVRSLSSDSKRIRKIVSNYEKGKAKGEDLFAIAMLSLLYPNDIYTALEQAGIKNDINTVFHYLEAADSVGIDDNLTAYGNLIVLLNNKYNRYHEKNDLLLLTDLLKSAKLLYSECKIKDNGNNEKKLYKLVLAGELMDLYYKMVTIDKANEKMYYQEAIELYYDCYKE